MKGRKEVGLQTNGMNMQMNMNFILRVSRKINFRGFCGLKYYFVVTVRVTVINICTYFCKAQNKIYPHIRSYK